jgi:hypothetical protein
MNIKINILVLVQHKKLAVVHDFLWHVQHKGTHPWTLSDSTVFFARHVQLQFQISIDLDHINIIVINKWKVNVMGGLDVLSFLLTSVG